MAAYAFMDYRSQGQTLPYVIIDIGSPPTVCMSRFEEAVEGQVSGCYVISTTSSSWQGTGGRLVGSATRPLKKNLTYKIFSAKGPKRTQRLLRYLP
jgi:hypothetical protein